MARRPAGSASLFRAPCHGGGGARTGMVPGEDLPLDVGGEARDDRPEDFVELPALGRVRSATPEHQTTGEDREASGVLKLRSTVGSTTASERDRRGPLGLLGRRGRKVIGRADQAFLLVEGINGRSHRGPESWAHAGMNPSFPSNARWRPPFAEHRCVTSDRNRGGTSAGKIDDT